MSSKIILVLFGILVFVAVSAALSNTEEQEELAEILSSEARVVRDADPARKRNNGKKRQKKKGRKAKRRNGKKGGGRGRKGARINKKNKQKKKGRKSKKRNGKKVGGPRMTGRTVSDTCFSTAMGYMKLWKDVVANFEKQNKRMTKQNSTGGNKSGKKGLFAPIAFKLVDIGGGNKTNMSCAGSTTSDGAKQLANLTKTLFDCEVDVNASCNPANFPQPNNTLIKMCENLTETFKTEAQGCLNKTLGATATTSSDACTCWTGAALNETANMMKMCKLPSEAKAISAALKKCTTAFGKCRKFEDGAIPAIMACSQSTSKLTAKAATLKANNDSLTSAKTKMSSLAGSTTSSGRRVRAVATSCAEVLTKAAALSSLASEFPTSDQISTMAQEISGAGTLTCTDAEKTSMTTQVTSMETAIASVSTAYESVQTLLLTQTGSTASASSLTTSAGTSTAASSGRRERLVRDIMKTRLN